MGSERKKLIISHKFKYIFIKTQKTASTSIEVGLERSCGEEDIISRHAFFKIQGFRPRNFEGFRQHTGASKIKEKIPNKTWNSYYKFTFERNPFDKMVSWYWDKRSRKKTNESFKEFCITCSKDPKNFPKGYELYAENNNVLVNFIGKYEKLNEDFSYVCNKLGIPFKGLFPRIRSHYRQDPYHYSKYYDSETKKIVENHFSKEIKMFDYSFETK